MSDIKSLLIRPRPYADESLKGLIVRATEENGYHTPLVVLSLAEVKVNNRTQRTLYTEQRWRNLSKVVNLDIPTLQDMACLLGIEETPPNAYNMFGHRVFKYSVRTGEPKICPGCLRENNYIRKIWDLAAFTCCPKHKVLLMEKCQRCGQKISWKRHKVSVCECGQDWKDVEMPEVSEAEMVLSRLILKVCGLWESHETGNDVTSKESISNPLSTVGLSELLCAVYFIIGQQNGVVDATGKHYAVKLPHGELHEALTNAVTVFENWPNNYFKLLSEAKGRDYKGERQSGLHRDFGKLYDPLFIKKNNPLPDFMRTAFKSYLTTCWDGGYAGWCGSMTVDELKAKRYMTRHEVVQYLQVSLMTVNRLHNKGFIRGEYHPWVNRSRIMIEANSVRELKKRWDKSINAIRAGEMLGIGRIAVISLVKSGCLVALQGPAVTGQLEWKFEISEVEQLLQLVFGKIAKGNTGALTPLVGFYKAIQKLSKLSIEVGAFVRMIIDGRVTPVATGEGTGLASLLFDAGEIEQFSRTEAVKLRGEMRTMQETAKLLHTKSEVVMSLVSSGLLIAAKSAEGRGGSWAISQEEINRFNNTYSTVNEIVNAFGTSTKGVSKRLMANGIMPVSGPTIDGGVAYIFKNADLEAVDIEAILPKANNSTLEKMNERGLVSKKQLSDITGCTLDQISRAVETGYIVPALTQQRKDGKSTRAFFSPDQIEKFKELKAEEARQLILFGAGQAGTRLAA